MKLLLVGPTASRARMRAALNGSIRVVGEFSTLDAAAAADVDADGILVADTVGRAFTARQAGRSAQSADRRPALAGRVATRPVLEAAPYEDNFHADADIGEEPLTPREIEVLELLAEGLPNKAIAARLRISDQTVKFHVASISGKLGASNRTDAVRRAVRRGLVTL
jgi:DNA-binding NarL/FixJ family response regulator